MIPQTDEQQLKASLFPFQAWVHQNPARYSQPITALDDPWRLSASFVVDPNPVGTILPYGGTTAPAGYLLVDGSAISRTTYASLFTVISTTYGVGDGTTTFSLPGSPGSLGSNNIDVEWVIKT